MLGIFRILQVYLILWTLATNRHTVSTMQYNTSTLEKYWLLGITAELPFSFTLGRRWNVVITRSDFKSKTIFGFLNPNYTGQSTCFFVKPKNGLVWPVFMFRLKKVLSRGFFVRALIIELNNWDRLHIRISSRTRITSVNLVHTLNNFFEEIAARAKLSLVHESTISSSSRGSTWLP